MTEVLEGACHCGSVGFEVALQEPIGQLIRCNCSFCKRRGAAVAIVPEQAFSLLRGADKLSTYRWNTGRERHHFCSVCGIYTHHTLADPPARIGVNAACLSGVDVFALGWVVGDGASLPLAPGERQRD